MELRVHGVSGTPPAEILYTEPVTYDQGPDLAKVYEKSRDSWDVKAYHWGSLTSKSALSAFWILLAPFAMANVAGWMSESPNVWSRAWIRIAGVSLTGIFFAQLANMVLDVPLATGMSETSVFSSYVGLCLLSVVGLGLISTQSSFSELSMGRRLRYLFLPSVGAMKPAGALPPVWDDPAGEISLVGLEMWTVHSIVHRLRRLHLTLGMAVLAVVAGRAVGDSAVAQAGLVVAGAMLVLVALTTGPPAGNRLVLTLTAVSPVAGLGVLGWGLWALGTGRVNADNVADDLTFEIALILGIAAGLGLLGELLASRFRHGLVSLGLLAVATLVGGTFGLTGSMLVESFLNRAEDTTETFDNGAAFVTVALLGMVIVMAVGFLVATRIPRAPGDRSAARRGILRARVVLAVAGVYAVVVGGAAAIAACSGGSAGCTQSNIDLPAWVVEDPENLTVLLGLPFDPGSLLGWAKILMVAIPAVLIVRSIVGGLLNGQESRRQVGVLWDLGSFWPRWFHPLGPPAYGPYAVSRLAAEIRRLQPDVLSAHSQGSVISAVAICLTDEDIAPGTFITYGSQMGDLYPSLFPAVGFDELVSCADAQVNGRWLNLWRPSDPVGGQVIESLGYRNWRVDTGRGHSRYELTPEFCAARKVAHTGDLNKPAAGDLMRCWEDG